MLYLVQRQLNQRKLLYQKKLNPKKSLIGTISYMPAIFGCVAASVVIRNLVGLEEIDFAPRKKSRVNLSH